MSVIMSEAPRLRLEDDPEEGLSFEDAYAKEVGRRIVTARRELGLTQVQLAQKVGVSQRSAQAWETGEVIPYRWMKKIARVLKRDAEWILHGDAAAEETRLARIEGQLDELSRLLRAMSKKIG